MSWWGVLAGLALAGVEGLARLRPGLLPPAVQAMTGRLAPSWRAAEGFRQAWAALHRPDPLLGYRLHPNLDLILAGPEFRFRLRTDGQGRRLPQPPDSADVLMVGDSFALGFGVEEHETWTAGLAGATGLRVASLGQGGFGTGQVLRLLEEEGLALRPRLVIWQFFKDDLLGAGQFAAWLESGQTDFLAWQRGRGAGLPGSQRPGLARRVRGWLFRNLAGYEWAKAMFGAGAYRPGRISHVAARVGGQVVRFDLAANRLWADFDRAEIERGWQATQESLLRAARLVREAGAAFLVVNVPSKEEVYWSWLPLRVRRANAWQFRAVSQRLARFGQEQRIGWLDLFDEFAAQAEAGPLLYFPNDAHWTRGGHQAAAAALARHLAGLEDFPQPGRGP